MPCPYNIIWGAEIRRRQCRVPTILFGVPKLGDGNAVSLQYYFG